MVTRVTRPVTDTVQTVGVVEANVTERPDVAVALTGNGATPSGWSPNIPNVIIWDAGFTVKVACEEDAKKFPCAGKFAASVWPPPVRTPSIRPPSICQIRVATSSIRSWSCVTSNTVPSYFCRAKLSALIDSRSRWLVGSSSARKFVQE